MMAFFMKMISFGRHEASKIEPKRVPGSSYLAVLWMAGCGQRDMGDGEGDMAVPGRSGLQNAPLDPPTPGRAEGPGRGRGGVLPLKTGVRGSARLHASSTRPEARGLGGLRNA